MLRYGGDGSEILISLSGCDLEVSTTVSSRTDTLAPVDLGIFLNLLFTALRQYGKETHNAVATIETAIARTSNIAHLISQ